MYRGRLHPLKDRTALWPFLVAVILFTWSKRSIADDKVEAQLREIQVSWLTLTESSKPFSYKYTSRLYRAEGAAPLKLVTERISQSVESSDGVLRDSLTYDHETGERKFDSHSVIISNDHYTCRLTDKSGDGRFILSGLPTMHDRKWLEQWSLENRLYGRLPWLNPDKTFCIPDLLDPKLSNIPRIDELGEGLLRITFRPRTELPASEKAKFRGVMAGTLVLNRNRRYRLESAEIQYDPQISHTKTYRFSYEVAPNEDYQLKGFESESKYIRKNDQVQMSGKEVWDYECRHDIEKIERHQLYMSHYGLPEPQGVTAPKKPIPLYYWILSGAVVLAGLSLLFRWLLKRRLRVAPTTLPTKVIV